jgi:hypothetical protein
MTGAIADTAIAPRSVVSRVAALEAQRREVSDVRLEVKQYLPQVKVTDEQVKAYYEANQADFRTPERVRAEYVVLSAEALARQDPPTESELRAAYDARANQFTVGEQRRASHILVKTKEEADKLFAEVKKNPNRFAELAKKSSQDPGSAEKGGDLGWFGRGMMVKPFEGRGVQAGPERDAGSGERVRLPRAARHRHRRRQVAPVRGGQEGAGRGNRAPERPAQVRGSGGELQQPGLRAVR